MNEKEFKMLFEIYKSKEPVYLREIVKRAGLPYGTVQKIIERNKELFDTKTEGKNKYFALKTNIQNRYLIQQLEIENTKQFLKEHSKLNPFITEILKLNIPILIFGSYAKNTQDKNSDLDILTFSDKKQELPTHLTSINTHNINITNTQVKEFKKEVLYKEIKDNHIIISDFETFMRVFENER